MSSWERVIEEGRVFWVNNDVGNIMKVGDFYVSMMPMICRLGPFKTLEEAQAAFSKKAELKQAIEHFNETMMGMLQ